MRNKSAFAVALVLCSFISNPSYAGDITREVFIPLEDALPRTKQLIYDAKCFNRDFGRAIAKRWIPGDRSAAETALCGALVDKPDYAPAKHNLQIPESAK